MDIRYSIHPDDAKLYDTEDLRRGFLIDNLYIEDAVTAVYSHEDRMTVIGCMPVNRAISLDEGIDSSAGFGVSYFLERREIGVFNLGGSGDITVDGKRYILDFEDCLYISMGSEEIVFRSESADAPARFYSVSAPAHRACATTLIPMSSAVTRRLGSAESANLRDINQFIHPDVLETCQLTMGLTKLATGSVWNTMPAHTHERRAEIYTYYELGRDGTVFHMMGRPEETRHIAVRDMQAVICPSWSIHAGCGTESYRFIWAMCGENQIFDDTDAVSAADIR